MDGRSTGEPFPHYWFSSRCSWFRNVWSAVWHQPTVPGGKTEKRVWEHVLLLSKRVSPETEVMFPVVVPVADKVAALQGSGSCGHIHSHKPTLGFHRGVGGIFHHPG